MFVIPKLYCYEEYDNDYLIRKASGVVASKLTYEEYVKLANGTDVLTNKDVFKLNWCKLKIEIVNSETKLKGLIE